MDRREFCKRIGIFSASLTAVKTEGIDKAEYQIESKIERQEVMPGDIIVLKHPAFLSQHHYEVIKEQFKKIFPKQKCLILEEGIDLEIIHKESKL